MLAMITLPVSAQWVTSEQGGDFDEPALRLAITTLGDYALGLRCKSQSAELIFITPDKSMSDPDVLKVANAVEPSLKYRIDGKDIHYLAAQLDTQDLGMAAIADVDFGDVARLRDAKRSISVVITLMGKNYHETRFGASGSTKAINELISGCELTAEVDEKVESEDSSDDLSYNNATTDDVRAALEIYYKRNINADSKCLLQEVGDKTYSFCRSDASPASGGLFWLRKDPEGTAIFALNGKAKQHIGASETLDVKDGISPVSMAHDQSIDIPEIIKAFK